MPFMARLGLREIPFTAEMEAALIAYMRAEAAMVREVTAGTLTWTWGRCYVGDMTDQRFLRFEYGTGDCPPDGHGDFAVVPEWSP